MNDKSMYWLKDDNGKITTGSMLECYDNAVKISAEMKEDEGPSGSATVET